MCYRTRGNLQRIHEVASNEIEVYAPPRVIQYGEGTSGTATQDREEEDVIIDIELDEEYGSR